MIILAKTEAGSRFATYDRYFEFDVKSYAVFDLDKIW